MQSEIVFLDCVRPLVVEMIYTIFNKVEIRYLGIQLEEDAVVHNH